MSKFALTLLCTLASVTTATLGDGLWRTFVHQTALPLTSAEATKQGWFAVSSCDNNLGILYSKSSSGSSADHPLSLYFTSAGQIAGAQAKIFGSNNVIAAAPPSLVERGFWKAAGADAWVLDVSFRAPGVMCSGATTTDVVGDRAVINQDTIRIALPLNASQAVSNKWTPGSCMESMGQHHFFDLNAAPKQSWKEEALLPVVPMYYPPDSTGVLHAFFFATPVAQPGSKDIFSAKADWEAPSLNVNNMCQNWCDSTCTWSTPAWSTMHIYLNSNWKTAKCPGGSGIVGRSCDL